MTTPLQINRYDRLVRRLMNLVGEGALVTGVLPDVFPTIDVEDLQTDAWGLAGWRPAMGGATITGAAAQRPYAQILNPAGSAMLTVVEAVIISSPNAGTIEFNLHDTVLLTLEPSSRWRDRRFPTLNFPVTQIREQSLAGSIITSPMGMALTASTPVVWQFPKGFLTLAPGTGFVFSHGTTTANLFMQFLWRERPADPAELRV